MKRCPLCVPATSGQAAPDAAAQPVDGASSRKPGRIVAGAVEWLLPGTILALLPKCPMCLAAYIALMTGIGMSTAVAAWLRTGLIVVCVVWIGALAATWIFPLIGRAGTVAMRLRRS